ERRHHLALPPADVHAGRHRRHGRAASGHIRGRGGRAEGRWRVTNRSWSIERTNGHAGAAVPTRFEGAWSRQRTTRSAPTRVPSAGVDAVFTDRLDLGRKMQARLLGMGTTMAMLEREPVIMTDVRRDPWVAGWFGYRFRAIGWDVVARWDDLDPPFFAEGPN